MKEPIARPADGIAWVTGASSGIGYALAARLAREGWTVAATARRAEPLTELAAACADAKGRIVPAPGDITDRTAMAELVETLEREEGPIALAVLNAGVYLPVEIPNFDAEVFEKSFNINVLGTVYCLEPLVPRCVARKAGQIALVSSVTGYGGLPTSGAYGATKAALINLAETMKIELDRHGVRVQIVNPGFVETPAQDDNTFPKPFMVSAETAAKRIASGLKSQAFEITFPKRFTYMLKLIGLLPARTRLGLVKKQTGWAKPPEAPAP